VKVRIYSPFLPYPVTEGAYRVLFDQAFSLLALGHEVELVTWKNSPAEFEERSQLWRAWGEARKKADGTIHCPVPVFKYLGPQADHRALRVLSSLWGKEASPESYYYPPSIQQRLKTLAPCDLAIYHYSFAHLWLKAPQFLPLEKRRVVHFHNLESELSILQVKNSGVFSQFIHRKNFEKLKNHETELSRLGHELWFLSPVDLDKFRTGQNPKKTPHGARLRLVPPTFSAEISEWVKQPILHSPETILGFIGGFDFQPNVDSARWILNHLVPALEKSGFRGKVQIAGQGALRVIYPEVQSKLVEVLPDSFSVDQFFAGLSWMLVPHLSGSGVRIKLLDALSKKIPVMATKAAVDRLHPELQTYPLILSSDDPELWTQQALKETPQGTRFKYQDLAFPQAMSGMEVYRDV
jgi:hypothetical protein